MKRALSTLGQMIVLCLAAFIGMLFLGRVIPSLHVVHILSQQNFVRRQYEYDWIFSAGFAYVVFLLLGVVTRRIRSSWISSTLAFVLTVLILALGTKIGFKDVNLLYGN